MKRIARYLVALCLALVLIGCAMRIDIGLADPNLHVLIVTPTAEPPPAQSSGQAVTSTLSTAPVSTSMPHLVTIRPNTATASDVQDTIGRVYVVQGERYLTTSVSSLGLNESNVQVALARPVTDTNRPPALTSSLSGDWIVINRTESVDEAQCSARPDLLWSEIRSRDTVSDPGRELPPVLIWDWQVTTFCLIPLGMPISQLQKTDWCTNTGCTELGLWVDEALVANTSSLAGTSTLYHFTRIEEDTAPGDEEQKAASCRSYGCNGGGSKCLYCWSQGCGC